jgi:hypothetical protein
MPIFTLTDLLAAPNSRKTYLCALTLGVRKRAWTTAQGYSNTYQTPFPAQSNGFPRSIVRVEENGLEYSPKQTAAEVDASASAFYWNDTTGTLYISPSTSDPTSSNLYIAVWFQIKLSNDSRDGSDSPLILDNCYYSPILVAVGPISSQATDLFGSLGSSPATCTIKIANGDGSLDAPFQDWIWIGGDAEIKFGGENLPLEHYTTIFKGKISKSSIDDYALTLALESGERIFTRQIPPNTFTTSQYPALASSDQGKPIPIVFGEVDKITPVRIDYLEDYYLELDGSTQYARIPNADIVALKFQGSFTVEAEVTFYDTSQMGGIVGIYNPDGRRSYLLYANSTIKDFRIVLSVDGSTLYCGMARTTYPRTFHKYTLRVAYNSAAQQVKMTVDGVDQTLENYGTIPPSLHVAAADFEIGSYGGGSEKLKGRIHKVLISAGYYPGTQQILQIVSHWKLDQNLLDSAGPNHLTGVSIDEPHFHLNHGLRLNGSNAAYINDTDQTGLDVTGPLTIAARIQPSRLEGRQTILSKWYETTNQRSYLLELNDDEVRLHLSSNGTAAYTISTTAADLLPGHWYEIKAAYNTADASKKIYINGVEQTVSTSGTAPTSIFNSSSQARIAGRLDEPFPLSAVLDYVAVAASYQADTGPIKDALSFWDFRKNLNDSKSSNHLKASAVESSHYLVLSSQSTYKIADHTLQSLLAIDSVCDGDQTVPQGDYQTDLDACEITLFTPISDKLSLSVRGAAMDNLLGNGSTTLITRAAYILKFLLQIVAGQNCDFFDEPSFLLAAAAAAMPLNLYLDKQRDLGSVLKEVCDSVFADLKVINGLYSLQLLDPGAAENAVEIYEEDLGHFSTLVEPRNIWNEISVLYAHNGSGESDFITETIPSAQYLYGRGLARRQFTTRLTQLQDALDFLQISRMLADSRQLLLQAEILSPKLINSDVGDKIKITRSRGPGGQLNSSSFEILEIEKNYQTGACRTLLSSLRGLGDLIARFTPTDHPTWTGSTEAQRLEGGYFTDDNGRADPDNPESETSNLFWR